ncbi:GspE/PulE family protein [Clostridium folliculivorans]|uniref:General secretion pathway protein GspE n=1 Tax=Clostridium folliculivorans TaxID=2886038 RepID=A0A9W5XZN4_9CLOT|nr:GspE/PulE family protein [Clostridium folliculivorans]GKU23976.1 general secretion pathway protein GspE [Clostridium folliculivorans]GKU30091.1 general secretion pathway protein GspE [Clostridium folliculivorans]
MVDIKEINIDTLKKVPRNAAVAMKVLPYKEDKEAVYALCVTNTIESSEYLSFVFEKNINYSKVSQEQFNQFINKFYLAISNKDNKLNKDVIVADIMQEYISHSIDKGASDIHIEPMENQAIIRIRVDGKLLIFRKTDKVIYNSLLTRMKLLANMDITEKRKPQDGKILFSRKNKKYDIRVSSIPTVYGEKLVLRILYNQIFPFEIHNLSYNEKQIEDINKLIELKHGLILICGPTGSGKSTTLYSILKSINRNDINITTIEDPVEIFIDGISQINVNEKAGITFSSGLRSVLRQDPDVIMVGEIRDEETAKIALRASITGHKVYSTIHTNSAIEVFSRLKDMGAEEYLLLDAIKGVISQRLVRRLCDCKMEYMAGEYEKKYGEVQSGIKLYKPKGCKKCNETGYSGRILISEVLLVDRNNRDKINSFIKSQKNIDAQRELKNQCKILLKNGVISFADYLEFVEGEAF